MFKLNKKNGGRLWGNICQWIIGSIYQTSSQTWTQDEAEDAQDVHPDLTDRELWSLRRYRLPSTTGYKKQLLIICTVTHVGNIFFLTTK